jgi:ceramide glucosyltransferase
MSPLAVLALLLPLSTTLWIAGGFVAVLLATRRRRRLDRAPGAVSVLKPLCGADQDLEANLESFFLQDHPDFELVFGVVDARDPALAVAHALMARHPKVPARTVVHAGSGALNPKIDNLTGLLPAARHDLLLVSDSNVRVPPHYVRELASIHARDQAGIVTNLFAGVGDDTFGAALENVQLCGFCAAGVALPTLLGDPVLVGKSALFSRRTLERLGGFERVRDVLAEDFVLGKTFTRAGEKLVVAPTVLANVTRTTSLGQMLARQLRWTMFRFSLRPVTATLEPLVSPLLLVPCAWVHLGPLSLAWAYALIALRDLGGWVALRGPRGAHLPILLGPLRELLALGVWAVAPFRRRVSWRGKRLRLGAGTLLYLEQARSGPALLGPSSPSPAPR